MILQIRTKDNLETILQQGNSPAWVIAESRVPEIQHVEIYQFDGKRVLKADFDAANSTRTESDRLIVAFKNAVIEQADLDWNRQNPVRYKEVEVQAEKSVLYCIIGKENTDRLNTLYKADKEFYKQNGFDFEWLNGIADTFYKQLLIGGSNSRAGDIIEFILGRYDRKENRYTGTPFTDVLKNISLNQSSLDQIKTIENDYFKKAEELNNDSSIEKRDNRAYHLFNDYIDAVNNELKKEAIIMQRSISPRGGEAFDLIFFYKNEQSDIINFLSGYRYAKDSFDGWWEDAMDFYTKNEKSIWYNQLISKENIDPSTSDIMYGFRFDTNISEDEYPSSNFEDLNISNANLHSFVEGEFAAWHYSKIKPVE